MEQKAKPCKIFIFFHYATIVESSSFSKWTVISYVIFQRNEIEGNLCQFLASVVLILWLFWSIIWKKIMWGWIANNCNKFPWIYPPPLLRLVMQQHWMFTSWSASSSPSLPSQSSPSWTLSPYTSRDSGSGRGINLKKVGALKYQIL